MPDILKKDGKLDKRFKDNREAVKNEDLMERIRRRHKIMTEADFDNRVDSLEDVEFVNLPGKQWQQNMKDERGKRPCYEYNKVKIRCKRVVNDIRDNRPSGKVRPVEGGDTEMAELYEGLIRNILNVSHADNATDYAAEYQVEGGMGAWRINTKFSDDTAFDQDIIIEGIENPYNLYADPSAKDFMKRDADDWILTERISNKEFDRKYGEAEKIDFEGDRQFDSDDDWYDDETVRVVEYWYKKPHIKDIWKVEVPDPDNSDEPKVIVVDSESDEGIALSRTKGFKPKDIRTVKTFIIEMVVASGKKVLEGPVRWAGHMFPFVMVFGEYKVIDGRKYWWGLVRNAKDAQRNYNISKTSIAETIAMAPKGKFWATPKQAAGLTDQWAESHKKNLPWNLYNPDPASPGPPTRMGAADVPIALMSQAEIDDRDLKDVMGVPDESVGRETNASSGRAIFARQQQGEIANFNYKDNHAKGYELTYEILIDLIPEIYDSERELRIIGSDGKTDYKRVNAVVQDPTTGKAIRINDMSFGKFDAVVTTGPAFATLRQEAVEIYANIATNFPQIWAVAGDLIMMSMDLPYADDIAKRLESILPPDIQQTLNSDEELPPEVEQAMRQVQQAMQQVQQHGQLVQEAAAELEGEKALNKQQKAEIKTELANVAKATAEFDAHVANEMLKLVKQETGLVGRDAALTMKGAELKEAVADFGQKAMSETVDAASALSMTENIDKVLAEFMLAVDQATNAHEEILAQIKGRVERKPIGGKTSREGGKLTAEVEFDDGTIERISAVRDGPDLKIVPEADAGPEPVA